MSQHQGDEMEYVANDNEMADDSNRSVKLLCRPKHLNKGYPGIYHWLVGSPFLLPLTIASILRCIHTLASSSSLDLRKESEDLRTLIPKGFEVIGALVSGDDTSVQAAIDAGIFCVRLHWTPTSNALTFRSSYSSSKNLDPLAQSNKDYIDLKKPQHRDTDQVLRPSHINFLATAPTTATTTRSCSALLSSPIHHSPKPQIAQERNTSQHQGDEMEIPGNPSLLVGSPFLLPVINASILRCIHTLAFSSSLDLRKESGDLWTLIPKGFEVIRALVSADENSVHAVIDVAREFRKLLYAKGTGEDQQLIGAIFDSDFGDLQFFVFKSRNSTSHDHVTSIIHEQHPEKSINLSSQNPDPLAQSNKDYIDLKKPQHRDGDQLKTINSTRKKHVAKGDEMEYVADDNEIADDSNRSVKLLCRPKRLNKGYPGIHHWLVRSPFLFPLTIASILRCIHTLASSSSPDLRKESEDPQTLIPKGFEVIRALVSGDDNGVHAAIDAAREFRKLLYTKGIGEDQPLIRAIFGSDSGDLQFFVFESKNATSHDPVTSIINEQHPEKCVWVNGCHAQ
ncbi:putative Ufm1-specific protease [Sesbania bispinosa]|nr:putative Ufm1-specific protease [Sesbania bispinosa]